MSENNTVEHEDTENETTEEKRNIVYLSSIEQFKLWKELESMKGEIETGRMSRQMVLPELKQRTGIEKLTVSHLKAAGKATGVKFYWNHGGGNGSSGGGKYLEPVKKRVEELEGKVKDLETYVTRLSKTVSELQQAFLNHLGNAPIHGGKRYRMENGQLAVIN